MKWFRAEDSVRRCPGCSTQGLQCLLVACLRMQLVARQAWQSRCPFHYMRLWISPS